MKLLNQNWQENGPIVIGGLGGSGTRLIAEILIKLGFFMGHDLNGANDNLLYTLLFKRPRWFYKNHQNKNEIHRGLSILHKLMLFDNTLSPSEIGFLLQATSSMAFFGENHKKNGRGMSAFKRMIKALGMKQKIKQKDYIGWGWKEPNSHLILDELSTHFRNFKYIHTMRHGLDIAFSENQQQLYNWGRLYDVPSPKDKTSEHIAAFQYWLNVHEKIKSQGESLPKEQFLLLNFDRLCTSPEVEIPKLLSFLNIKIDKGSYHDLLKLPKRPHSVGRFKHHDISKFNRISIEHLRTFGFDIERNIH